MVTIEEIGIPRNTVGTELHLNVSSTVQNSISLSYLRRTWLAPGELSAMRQSLAKDGYCYLYDVPDDFEHVLLLREFGEFMPQYDGELIWDLRPEPGMDDVYHSRNTQSLLPHTEMYERAGNPPRYVALWCVRPAAGAGGETTLADGYEWLADFTEDGLRTMRERKYLWHSSEGLARKEIHVSAEHAILEDDSEGQSILRYSYNNVVRVDDGFLPACLESGWNFFSDMHRAIDIEQNALLLWDNWRMLHSRNAFRDPDRHLKRVLIV